MSELPNELLIKIISFLPTKFAVSTSVLSKQWEFLWMWSPTLKYTTDFRYSKPTLKNFINKYLPLHKAPVIESLHLKLMDASTEPEDIKQWVGIAVSRCVRELKIHRSWFKDDDVLLPSSLYTCKSLVTLKLEGSIIVDVPQIVFLPSLKTCQLQHVKYSKKDSLRMLLSHCPVLEDLIIRRTVYDNMGALVVNVPSLKRLSFLKYFKVEDYRESVSYVTGHMPNLEEAYICVMQDIEKLLVSITSVKRLSLGVQPVYLPGIVFSQLEHLKLCISKTYWSKLLFRLLKVSPQLRVIYVDVDRYGRYEEYQSVSWNNEQGSVPECLLKSLESFNFAGYKGREEERDFVSFFFKYARCLNYSSLYR